MRYYWLYWKENLSRSFAIWGKGEEMTTSIILAISLIIGIASGFASNALFQIQGLPYAIGLGIFLFVLLFLLTPMRLWKEQRKRLDALTTPRLKIDAAPIYIHPLKKDKWFRLVVRNISGIPVKNCSAQIVEYTRIDQATGKILPSIGLPPSGTKLPWGIPNMGLNEKATIPPNGSAYITCVVTETNGDFSTPAIEPPQPSIFEFVQGISDRRLGFPNKTYGIYKLCIEVGSEETEMPTCHAIVTFKAKRYDFERLGLEVSL